MTKEAESWSFPLPKIMDDDGQPVTLSVNFGTAGSFCYLNDVTSIDIDDISDTAKVREGMYLITFVLNDGKDEARIAFSLFVLAPPPDPVEETAAAEEVAAETTSEEGMANPEVGEGAEAT
jgi:hypothetical protein